MAVSFAQSGSAIRPFGTTHADYFHGEIPCARSLTEAEINGEYEKNTGKVIIKTFEDKDPDAIPGVLVKNHDPFAWGKDPIDAVHNAAVMEEVAAMTFNTIMINRGTEDVPSHLMDRHYLRKHGRNAYYGQEKK